jgi:integrase
MTRKYADYVYRRGSVFYFRISVPKNAQHRFGGRAQIWRSLKTSNKHEAYALAGRLAKEHQQLFKEAHTESEGGGFSYQTLAAFQCERGAVYKPDFALLPAEGRALFEAVLARLAPLFFLSNPSKIEVAAIAGVAPPSLSLDQMFERYEELSAGKWNDLDPRQRQKKWNRYREPIEDFKRHMGDLDVLKITTKDVGDYVVNLSKRIKAGEFVSETAQKKLLFINATVTKVLNSDFPDHKSPFEGAKIEHSGNDKSKRHTLTEPEFIALEQHLGKARVNEEIKAILTVMANTGTIVSEIVLVHENDIHLEAEIPFVRIGKNPNRNSVKTENRERDIPLVGPALEAFRKFPKGFKRYCRPLGPEAFSANANKIIKQFAPEASTYSLRHRFIDWLREVEGMEDSWLKSIIGHDGSMTGRYGKGYSMRKKLNAIQKAMELAKEEQAKIKLKHQTRSTTNKGEPCTDTHTTSF